MSINADKKKVSVDFDYSQENDDGSSDFNISVRLHYTDEYGQTLSFSTDGEEYVGLPVKFFAEVVDFLREEGYLARSKLTSQFGTVDVMASADQNPVMMKKNVIATKLPLPNISKEEQNIHQNTNISNPVPLSAKPVQTFYPESRIPSEVPPIETAAEIITDDNESEAVIATSHHSVTKEEAEKMLQERLKAKTKSNTEKGIRRAHQTGGDE